MSKKSLAARATALVNRQVLTVKTHSPVLLLGVGIIGFGASTYLACRATLKVSDILAEGEENLKRVDAAADSHDEEEIKKASFGVKLQTALKVVKAYMPATIIGVGAIAAMTGSYVILNKRNVALTASYAVLNSSFKKYRERVVDDQGAEKDLEYRFGVGQKDIVEMDEHGEKIVTITGLDQEAIEKDAEFTYARVFNRKNKHWSDIPNQNQFFLQMIQSQVNDLLELEGVVFLSDVYDLLGFKPTAASRMVGWKRNPENGEGDGYIDFGVWNEGVFQGKQWLNGDKDAVLLDFNVQGTVLSALDEV